ncbi:MAG: response regulator [Acidobacteriota bacterium]
MPTEGPRAKVLIVEDDDSTRQLLAALMKRNGVEALAVQGGKEAIAALGQRTFDLAILDLMMPDTSGYEVIAFLLARNLRMPVIVCTAAGPRSTEQIDAPFVRAIVRKPFDITALVSLVAEILRESP